MTVRTRLLAFSAAALGILATACGSAPVPKAPDGAPTSVSVQTQIVTAHEATNERTLLARGEEALMSQRWQEAIEALSTLVAANGKLYGFWYRPEDRMGSPWNAVRESGLEGSDPGKCRAALYPPA